MATTKNTISTQDIINFLESATIREETIQLLASRQNASEPTQQKRVETGRFLLRLFKTDHIKNLLPKS